MEFIVEQCVKHLCENVQNLDAEDISRLRAVSDELKNIGFDGKGKHSGDVLLKQITDVIAKWEELYMPKKEQSPVEKIIDKYINERVKPLLGDVDTKQLRYTLNDFAQYVLKA